ncbi:TonB-dependent receptor [Reichenbachiella ulvae]|uniref:TonB-dependent receptor n=1 Tax=Reichenbachiella ulvae TaxID=2980104 RepID=A0ABT3CRW7_9BACT|nr:TonB-dependent receptor [Reichenbachiella ulvae]MCV9386427.1 TonB-dependent receptor [Reichenbachiella ulvae]
MKQVSSRVCFTLAILLIGFAVSAQQLTQSIRGTLKDVASHEAIIGANITVKGSSPIIGASTDINGVFELSDVPVGRVTLQISSIGYISQSIPNIIVDSGKEVILNLKMEESIVQMDEIVIQSEEQEGRPINDMALVSARSLSPEQTQRFPGGFNDPSRAVSNFAGVNAKPDGGNEIIVRGNAPKYVQWRLEGIEITNPNHFADQSTTSGSISALNNNMLSTSDFYTGAFSAEYGDALSAVYDVRLRSGNNQKRETIAGVGLLGTDLTFEGPFSPKSNASYVVNYRYSTISLINEIGLADVNGVPVFQDAAFKLNFPTQKAGSFSLFGLSGLSHFIFEDVKPDIWETPGDEARNASIHEDYQKQAHLINLGFSHHIPITKSSFLNTTLLYSNEGIADDVYEYGIMSSNSDSNQDSIVNRQKNFDNQLIKSAIRSALTYHHKFNAKHKVELGTKYARLDYMMEQSMLNDTKDQRITGVDFDENISTLRNFISWRYRINNQLTLVTGLHNMNVLYNHKSTLEPRFSINWQLAPNMSIHAGYGSHSSMETIHHYFAKVEQEDGSYSEPNKDLDLLKAHHYVLGITQYIGEQMRLSVEMYYQYLYDLPVASDSSYFSTINEGTDFQHITLVNAGKGQNYGLELTLERFFANNYHYMINGSVYQSKYETLEGIERNTKFNSEYVFNLLAGKDFVNLGKKRNQVLSINLRAYYGGAQKIIPLLRDDQQNLNVDPANNQYWDYDKAYNDGLDDLFQTTLSVSYKWNRPKATHELFVDLNNLTGNDGRITEYYDESEPNNIGYLRQFEFFPNLMYKVYF